MEKKTKIILGVVAVVSAAYFTRNKWMSFFKPEEKKSGFISCRTGTCPFTRADGSVFCTSAACLKSTKSSTN